MDKTTELSKACARLIISILIMTRLKDKQQLIDTTKLMCDVANSSAEYSPSTRRVYRVVHNFFKVIWQEDLNKIVDIVFED